MATTGTKSADVPGQAARSDDAPTPSGQRGRSAALAESDQGTCGVLSEMDDERIHLMGLLIRTHRRLTDSLGREMEHTAGIPLVFFNVLIHVAAAPDGRVTMSQLSAEVALTTGGVTRLVDRMVEAGLVVRQNCPNDRRSIHVVLTPEGRSVLDRAITVHVEGIDRHLVAHLDQADRDALEAVLTKLLDSGC